MIAGKQMLCQKCCSAARSNKRNNAIIADCKRCMEDADCDIAPARAGDAQFFAAVTPSQLAEFAEKRFQLKPNHVVALCKDKAINKMELNMELDHNMHCCLKPE